ncbi:MAG TPA: hypothetical protein VJH68_01290 [Candidatus Nanoarchaeia archaeon]|nr:hypothetical protein [Candidatus Nanoarchaeia archaeon]
MACWGYGMMGYGLGGWLMVLLYYLILIEVVVALALLIKKLWLETQPGNRRKRR